MKNIETIKSMENIQNINIEDIDKEAYNCVKDINVCNKYKTNIVKKEERTIFNIKKSNFGYIATVLSIISFLPIVYNIYKTKKTNNFNYISIFISFFISGLWIYFGIHEKSTVTMLRSMLFICIYAFILYMKIMY